MPDRDAHSPLGASCAHRWMNCPGSVRLSAGLTSPTTEYALEGTAAHALAEQCLLHGTMPEDSIGSVIEGVTITSDMASAVRLYVDVIRADQMLYGGTLCVETSFDLSHVHEGMHGRNDAALIPAEEDGVLRVYDYKNGRKGVDAEGNPQLRYYAIGCVHALGLKPTTVEMVIIQPHRQDGKSPVLRSRMTWPELKQWEGELATAAEATESANAPLNMGPWCFFCPAQALCPTQKAAVVEAFPELDRAVETMVLPPAELLDPVDVSKLARFFTGDAFCHWVKSLAATEQELLSRGVDIPGRKLVMVQRQGTRKWVNEADVTSAFGEAVLETRLLSPAAAERNLVANGMTRAEAKDAVSKLTTRDLTTQYRVVDEANAGEAEQVINYFN